MVIVEIDAGLGNQMFQYAFGRWLSLQRRELLIIDTKKYSSLALRLYALDKFRIKCIHINSSKRGGRWIRKIFELFSQKKILEVDNEPVWEMHENLLFKEYNLLLKGTWPFLSCIYRLRTKLQKEILLKPRHLKRYQPIINQLAHENSVCLHVRRGDYVSSKEANLIFNVLEADYYDAAIRKVLSSVQQPVFYLFSDDNVKALNLIRGLGFNIDIQCLDVENDYACFELMKACKHFIIANSTFSWWAAWLGKTDNSIVVQPKYWFKDELLQQAYSSDIIIGSIGEKI